MTDAARGEMSSAPDDGPVEVVDIVGNLPYASNATLLGRTADGVLVVYKPARGERPLWDFPYGTLPEREILTYEIARAMGLDIVPETSSATGPYGPGSAQVFVEEDPTFDPRPLVRGDRRAWPFALLDLVVNNADRKLGHILAEAGTGRLVGIDHGLTFHPEPKLRTVLWALAGSPVPPALQAAVVRLDHALDAEGLAERVRERLGTAEAEALRRRVAALLAEPVHPHPPEDRPAIPWPPY